MPEINQSYTATANGNYAVIVTENGCTDTSACVNISITSVGIDYLELNEGIISFYPNPTTENITIDLNDLKIEMITITNRMGKAIETFIPSNNTINVSSLTNGIYFFRDSHLAT